MSQVAEALQVGQAKLEQADIGSARLDAELLLSHVLDVDRAWLLSHSEQPLLPAQQRRYQQFIDRRARHEPVAYLTKVREFYGLPFRVGAEALIPRPETEPMVAAIIEQAPAKATILDLGTGCGAIGVAVAAHRPDITVTLSDVSNDALRLASQNARLLLSNRQLTLVQSDLFDQLPNRYDVVAANLPYVPASKRDHITPDAHYEPPLALYGGDDGLDYYRRFFASVGEHLTAAGLVFCEADPWQHAALLELARAAGLRSSFTDYLILGFTVGPGSASTSR